MTQTPEDKARAFQNRESRLRRQATRRGLLLHKYRMAHPSPNVYSAYSLIDEKTNTVVAADLNLNEVQEHLDGLDEQ